MLNIENNIVTNTDGEVPTNIAQKSTEHNIEQRISQNDFRPVASLFSLPAEVRLLIYKCCTEVRAGPSQDDRVERHKISKLRHNLLLVSRQISEEVLPIVYSAWTFVADGRRRPFPENYWHVKTSRNYSAYDFQYDFLEKTPGNKLARIRKIAYRVDTDYPWMQFSEIHTRRLARVLLKFCNQLVDLEQVSLYADYRTACLYGRRMVATPWPPCESILETWWRRASDCSQGLDWCFTQECFSQDDLRPGHVYRYRIRR